VSGHLAVDAFDPKAFKGRSCEGCGCTDGRACLEFDAKGYAHACYWVATDFCSACMFGEHVEPPDFDEGVDTRITAPAGKRGKAFKYLRVPELAGMVARPRRAR
jgi:hypothetical protein